MNAERHRCKDCGRTHLDIATWKACESQTRERIDRELNRQMDEFHKANREMLARLAIDGKAVTR